MFRKNILLILLLITSFSVFAQDAEDIYEKPFNLLLPEIVGQGGSYTAVSEGVGALFSNPAGFASDRTDFTLVALNPWFYLRPDKLAAVLEPIINGDESDEAVANVISELTGQAVSNGLGFGFSTGLNFVGSGLGLGVSAVADVLLSGKTLTGISGDGIVTIAGVGGYAVDFDLGILRLKVGGDVRPMVRLHLAIPNSAALEMLGGIAGGGDPLASLMGLNALYGTALAIDLGAILEFGPFSAGLSIRDLGGTTFNYTEQSLEDTLADLQAGTEGEELVIGGTPAPGNYVTPMEINLGAAFHPDLGGLSNLIDPQVHIDLKDPIAVIRDGRSPWTLLHIGGEVKLLRFINVRAGLNQGFLTFGAGLDIPFMNINISTFSRAKGVYLKDGATSGVSLELAIRL
jgi:hypothetical protein